MRDDAIGLFWEDIPVKGKKAARMMPDIPDTGWKAPATFPDLTSAELISVDVETYDPHLITMGPGWARGIGHIVGVSVGAWNKSANGRWYFPIRHEIEPEDNLCPDAVFRWLRHTLAGPQPKIGANLMYDVGWLQEENITVNGELLDMQFAEALLTERADLDLETMAQKYLGEGKESNLLYQWCSSFYGGPMTGKQRANIYRAPPRLVGPYAESDADLPLRLWPILAPLLSAEGLLNLFYMECRLIRLLLEMRSVGVTVDIEKAEELNAKLRKRIVKEQEQLDKVAGTHVEIASADSLAKAFDAHGLKYGRTEKGAPSFTKAFLAKVKHPITKHVNEIRRLEKLSGTFLESYIINSHINGKLYCQFHPLRSDDGGTRSGRFSSSTPNLQNIPSRDEELAPLIRGLFIPDYGHLQWRKYDYSQIEYRFLIHFGVGPGIEEARRLFIHDPSTDYHDMALDLVAPEAGWDVSTPDKRKERRRPIKNINFGLIFGMGIPKLSRSLGLNVQQGRELFKAYHKAVPFAKATMDDCSDFAENHGYITTVLGRRSRFDLWVPAKYSPEVVTPLPYEEAIMEYGSVRRAYVHKALNRRLQGSAADLIKMAMLQCYEDGVFDDIGVPRLQVHDELNFSDPGGKDKGFAEMQHIMENALELNIPVLADGEIGPDWGHVK